MAAPVGGVHPSAVVGNPPEHRDYRREGTTAGVFWTDRDRVLVAESALLEAFVTVDAGIERATRICEGVWLMKHVHVGHDADIGPRCELAPGTVIGGHARLGADVRCGIGVLVLPFVNVGDGARLGAGAVVTKDVPDGEVWVGNPAEEIEAFRARRLKTDDMAMFAEQFERGRGAGTDAVAGRSPEPAPCTESGITLARYRGAA